MDVSDTLKKAWAAVEVADLPDTIHEVAFREAVRMLSPAPVAAAAASLGPTRLPDQTGKSGQVVAGATEGGSGGGGSSGDGSKVTEDESALLEKVARNTDVAREKIEDLVYLDDGVLKVSLPGIKLGKNNADRTRAITQILTIVRSFGLDEDETSLELVRAEAQRLKCYDSANFASQIKRLPGYLITGSGTNRRIRVKSAGTVAFSALVDSLLDES